MRPFEQRRHEEGRCIQCNEPKDPLSFLRCKSCRAKVNANSYRHFARTFKPKTARGIAAQMIRNASKNEHT